MRDEHQESPLEQTGFYARYKKALSMFGFRQSVALYLLLRVYRKRFIDSAPSEGERAFRRRMCSEFDNIHDHVLCPHSPFQFICVSEFVFDLDLVGPIVECGVFKGGSTAQLSLIAKKTNRKLYVCDSFQGLPSPEADEHLLSSFDKSFSRDLKTADYCGTLDEVKENVSKYGCIEVCEFVPGFFNKSLPGLAVTPAVVFIDVDLVSSARDCLMSLWPRLKEGGLLFTHEARFKDYVEGFMDRTWWNDNLGTCPPVLWGAGSGLSPVASSIAMLKKP